MTYYNQDGIIARRSEMGDVDLFKHCLRLSDIEEIWASHHLTPEMAVKMCIAETMWSCTVLANGKAVAIFGINPETIFGKKALVWMLATEELNKIPRRFARHSRKFIDYMLEQYPYLYNYVDDRNKKSIEWLRFCGADIHDPKPFGIEQLPFRYFSFTR